MKLYGDLAPWWPLLSAPEDYAEEAAIFTHAIDSHARRSVHTLLELGSGGGNTASQLKRRFRVTLADRSEPMLAVSRALNPECEHVVGDMRTLRLGHRFDAVLIHDAIMYMTTKSDLAAAITTAAHHLELGGVALFVPDDTAETYTDGTGSGGHDEPGRSLRYFEWHQRLRQDESRFVTTYVLLLRESDLKPRAEIEHHELGLFPRATWLQLIADAGLQPATMPFAHSTFDPARPRDMFIGLSSTV